MTFVRWCIGLLVGCVLAGTALYAADFQNQVYRGFNLDRALSKSVEDFNDLAAMGANLVRVWGGLERCTQCKSYSIVPGKEEIERLVSLAQAAQIYVILTMAPEGPERAAYWADAALQQSIIDIWTGPAERYKGQPAMGGFDLLNEPNPPGKAKEAAWASIQQV